MADMLSYISFLIRRALETFWSSFDLMFAKHKIRELSNVVNKAC